MIEESIYHCTDISISLSRFKTVIIIRTVYLILEMIELRCIVLHCCIALFLCCVVLRCCDVEMLFLMWYMNWNVRHCITIIVINYRYMITISYNNIVHYLFLEYYLYIYIFIILSRVTFLFIYLFDLEIIMMDEKNSMICWMSFVILDNNW